MNARRSEGRAGLGTLVLLLLLIGGGGAWNYQKNMAAEQDVYRPFRSYTEADLADLSQALDQQKDSDSARYERAASQRAEARHRAHYDQRLEEFERVQQAGARTRSMRAELAKSTTTIKLVAEEQRLRSAEADPETARGTVCEVMGESGLFTDS